MSVTSRADKQDLIECWLVWGQFLSIKVSSFFNSKDTTAIILLTTSKLFASDPPDHTKYWIFLMCWYTKEEARKKSRKSWAHSILLAVTTAEANTRMLSFIEVNCALKDWKYGHWQIEKWVVRTAVFYFQPTQWLATKLHIWVMVRRRYNFSASLWSAGAASVMYLSSR